MRTVIHRTARLLGGLALLTGILLALSAQARAQTITAEPQTVIVSKDAAQGATKITWDAGGGIKSLGATLWQQIDGGEETLVAAKRKGSQSILIGAGETRVFKLHNFIKSKVLASVTVTATGQGAAPDENAPNAGGAPARFAGEWETTSNNAQVTMTLQQIGDKVTGTYTPNNGKIEGTIKDRILRFKWTSDGGAGSGRFVLDKNEMNFSGSYSNGDDPEQPDGTWNGTRKVGGSGGKTTVSFAGMWAAGQKISDRITSLTFKFEQTGNKVTGYAFFENNEKGKVDFEGVVSGNKLRFQVSFPSLSTGRRDEGGEGREGVENRGEFVMAQDGKSFTGNIGKGRAVIATVLANFAGVWHAKWGEAGFLELILQQSGPQVTGQVRSNSADVDVIREGTVVGNTLRFNIVRPRTVSGVIVFDHVLGIGELVMDEGGKLFTGHVLGTATSGVTLIAR